MGAVQTPYQFEDGFGGFSIQVARRLVCQKNLRLSNESSGK